MARKASWHTTEVHSSLKSAATPAALLRQGPIRPPHAAHAEWRRRRCRRSKSANRGGLVVPARERPQCHTRRRKQASQPHASSSSRRAMKGRGRSSARPHGLAERQDGFSQPEGSPAAVDRLLLRVRRRAGADARSAAADARAASPRRRRALPRLQCVRVRLCQLKSLQSHPRAASRWPAGWIDRHPTHRELHRVVNVVGCVGVLCEKIGCIGTVCSSAALTRHWSSERSARAPEQHQHPHRGIKHHAPLQGHIRLF